MSSKKNTNIDNVSVKVLKQIRSMMRDDSISVKNLSSKMGISMSSLSGLLRQDNISLNKLADICNALGYRLEVNVVRDDASNTTDTGLTQEQLQRILAYAKEIAGSSNSIDSIDTNNTDNTQE